MDKRTRPADVPICVRRRVRPATYGGNSMGTEIDPQSVEFDALDLIPRAPIIRERLAKNLRERRLLRRLLRLAIDRAEAEIEASVNRLERGGS